MGTKTPTLLTWKSYRFFFYSNEIGEPAHIHVLKDNAQLKIWLGSLEIAKNVRFKAHEVNAIVSQVREHREEFLEAWNAHFGN